LGDFIAKKREKNWKHQNVTMETSRMWKKNVISVIFGALGAS